MVRRALLMLDLDNFKQINETLGYDMGDRLLQAVAERLRACVPDDDTLARHGGDEFVVVLRIWRHAGGGRSQGRGGRAEDAAGHARAFRDRWRRAAPPTLSGASPSSGPA